MDQAEDYHSRKFLSFAVDYQTLQLQAHNMNKDAIHTSMGSGTRPTQPTKVRGTWLIFYDYNSH